jgi:hypothetical protein
MRLRALLVAACLTFCLWEALHAFQVGFQTYPYEENDPAAVPPGANDKTEWAFARLRYPSVNYGRRRGVYYSWGTDYPKADRQFVEGVRRLSRIDACSAERVINLDNDEIFYWPWVYAVEVGQWDLTDAQCKRIREYLMRGGFLMVDDFHGTAEWAIFMASMSRIFPDRPVVDIDSKDPIFHTVFDLDNRVQVPGLQYLRSGRTYEKDGVEPKWRAIYDDRGRIMVAMCHNQDNGDAWEWADLPAYPADFTIQAYRLGINYILYAMTH